MSAVTPNNSSQSPSLKLAIAIGGGLALVLAAIVFLVIFVTEDESPDALTTPSDTSVDVGFARDMKQHHAQAVEMASLVLDRTNDDDIRTLARDILLTQEQQIGQMYGWLELWSLPQSSTAPAMAWMGEDMSSMPGHDMSSMTAAAMPGMASDEEIARLTAADGRAADRLFLQLMIPHHQGALEMAEVAMRDAETPQVRSLAASILQSQSAELKVLKSMLADRGGPLPAS